MKKNFKLGVIGCGFMASAIIKGAIESKVVDAKEVIVSDVSTISLGKIKEFGVSTTTDNNELVEKSEFVLFAVKPQSVGDVLCQIKGSKCNKFISIMAGIKKQKIRDVFPNSKIARLMPNTPCSIGAGAVGLDLSDFKCNRDKKFIKTLFSALASVVLVDEDKLNAVTGVSGSSPAYFYLFLKGIIESGVKHGLTYDDAKTLAVSTMIGAGKMVQQNNEKSLDDLINAVCSKGGTTIEAINTYNECELTKITEKAIDACVKRASELENI